MNVRAKYEALRDASGAALLLAMVGIASGLFAELPQAYYVVPPLLLAAILCSKKARQIKGLNGRPISVNFR